jgi:membrane-associated phospholipid phosphatase
LRASRAAVLLLALLGTFGCASAKRWGSLAAHDVADLVTAPKHATATQWKRAAFAAGAIAASAALDEGVRDASHANQSRAADNIAEIVEPFGGRYGDRVLYGFLLAGAVTGNDKAKAIAFDGLVSSLLATKVAAPLLKEIVGRDRPNEAEGAFEFHGGSSFPSSHATQAFAIASVVAGHSDSRWLDAGAYGLATLVGLARVRHDAHWLSDVVAGAVIGTATGRFIVATNNRRRATWSVQPIVGEGRRGVAVVVSLRSPRWPVSGGN